MLTDKDIFITKNHVHNIATSTEPGFMSVEDKKKLDGIGGSVAENNAFIPFRLDLPKSLKAAGNSYNSATLGSWVDIGNWQLATCYSSGNIQVGGMYNDDMIHITGFNNSGTLGNLQEFIGTPPIVIQRKDGIDIQNLCTDYQVGTVSLYENKRGYCTGTAFTCAWYDKIGDIQHYYLKISFMKLVDGNTSTFSVDSNDINKHGFQILNVDWHWCKASILKTQ